MATKKQTSSKTKTSTKSKSPTKGLPIILLLVLLGIMLYGFLKMNNLTGPATTEKPTSSVQQPVENVSMDKTMMEVQESSSTAEAIDKALNDMDASETQVEVPPESDLSEMEASM